MRKDIKSKMTGINARNAMMRYELTTRLMQQASHSSSPHTLQELDEETAEAADACNAWLRQENTATTGVKAEPAVVPAVEYGKRR